MKLSIYQRTEDGEISFHGVRSYDSPAAMFRAIYLKNPLPPEEIGVLGKEWADRCVTWRGRWGYAGGPSKLKLRQVNLTDEQVEVAKSIGDGNISEGIRLALSAFQ